MKHSRSNKLRRMWPIRADYEFKAEFATADAAPIADPLLCDVGSLDVTDTENKFSVAGGELVCAGGKAIPAWGEPSAVSIQSWVRTPGRAIVARITALAANQRIGWDISRPQWYVTDGLNGSNVLLVNNKCITISYVTPPIDVAIVQRTTGALFLRKLVASSAYNLEYVSAASTGTPLFAVALNVYSGAASSVSSVRVLDLPGAWAQDYGIARAREITPSGAALETTKDFIAEISIANDPGGALSGMELCTDGIDDWVRVYHNGTNATMKKTVGGVETGLIDAAAAYVAGKRLVVVKDGTSWKMFWNEAQVGATQTINDGSIKDTPTHKSYKTGAAVNNNFVLWPRFVTMPRGV